MTPRKKDTLTRRLYLMALLLLALVGCQSGPSESTPAAQATDTIPAEGPPATTAVSSPVPVATAPPTAVDQEEVTLGSLQKLDDHPLYTMRYQGAYEHRAPLDATKPAEEVGNVRRPGLQPAWSCSLFAALGDPGNPLYGRNFDWEHSPALLLFTDPPDGYASVSMVDMAYLGFSQEALSRLTELPLDERRPLLRAPLMPFDGMNEHGLAVGMAAVPPGGVPPDPAKETVGSLEVIREMLDHARTVEDAVAILQGYNIAFGGGPPLHYLIAEPAGQSALVELYQGELVIIHNTEPWHLATNFLVASIQNGSPEESYWRYDLISEELVGQAGRLAQGAALDLLSSVSQPNTQWSIVYGMSSGEITVAMGRRFSRRLELALTMATP
jgi:hypothetical protein